MDRDLAEVEDPVEPAPDEPPADQAEPSQRQDVLDVVAHSRAAALGKELVRVHPQAVRPRQLAVDKPMRRFPAADFRSPAEGDAEKRQPIVDERAATEFDGLG